jgi:2-polyprenyl-3-methyl-5-hydroxy-6-metoxy-1,4-benzoquinol methylase
MKIGLRPQSGSFDYFDSCIETYILKYNCKNICEIGAGANPFLTEAFVSQNSINYTLYDKAQTELDKSNSPFKRVAIDFCDKKITIKDKYDLVFSKMVLEHVEKPDIFHKNIESILSSQGVAIHFFTTLYSTPTIANLLLPEKIAFYILKKLQKRNFETEGKFIAYYRKCYGPRKKAITYFQKRHFKVLEYIGYPGHHYFWRNKFIYAIEKSYNRFLLKLNSPMFTTSAIVVLQKQKIK